MIVHENKIKVDGITRYVENQNFEFDNWYGEEETTLGMYQNAILPEMDFIFNGGTLTIFAYGQTGSGKTFTINQLQGLLSKDLFRASVLHEEDTGNSYCFTVSYFEIYGSKVFDLLSKRKELKIMETAKNKIEVPGLREIMVKDEEELAQVVEYGRNERCTEETVHNSTSSRSHAVCKIKLINADEPNSKEEGSLLIVDLAGSERAHDSQDNTKDRQREGAEINKSLLALKECIRAMQSTRANKHIPFRTSKLTMVLKDSFVAEKSKVRVHMIACISPCHSSVDHTLNTLRYAEKLKTKSSSPKTSASSKNIKKDFSTPNLKGPKVTEYSDLSNMKMRPKKNYYSNVSDAYRNKRDQRKKSIANSTNSSSPPNKLAWVKSQGDLLAHNYSSRRDQIKAQRLKSRDSSNSSSNEEQLNDLMEQINDVYSDIKNKLSSFHPDAKKESRKTKGINRSFTSDPKKVKNSAYMQYCHNNNRKAKKVDEVSYQSGDYYHSIDEHSDSDDEKIKKPKVNKPSNFSTQKNVPAYSNYFSQVSKKGVEDWEDEVPIDDSPMAYKQS